MTTIHPLTPERWPDLEKLFGPRGACGGCWCMYWRLSRQQFSAQQGEVNRQELKSLVASGKNPGLLAYVEDEPIGWCSIAPRDEFPVLARSRILKPVDDLPVWSVVCFFVNRTHRRQGLTVLLLKAAVDYAARGGASIVEGYPVDPKEGKAPDVFVYTGLYSTFQQAGFTEVARRSATRPIMRYPI
ncbi:MAG: GNAT family N-acetyltransferase [Anaerolineales bacterium]|nr:GNAT family N-acetyltransferase [Anaerolineae bacterium]PWB50287.1 MAG: GNAT family N-acetyltransferase [Anaerolineales bacterium]